MPKKKSIKDTFNCHICNRPMRKDVHTHKVGGGTVKIHKPKGL